MIETTPVIAAFYYEGAVRTAIHELKYRSRPALAFPLAQQMARTWSSHVHSNVCVVPVPIPPARLRTRGYNQAALLAQALVQELNNSTPFKHSFAPRTLYRGREVARQVALSRAERLRNLQDVMRVRHVPTRQVILIDDVLTTGATALACIRALEHHEVRVEAVVVCALADKAAFRPE